MPEGEGVTLETENVVIQMSQLENRIIYYIASERNENRGHFVGARHDSALRPKYLPPTGPVMPGPYNGFTP